MYKLDKYFYILGALICVLSIVTKQYMEIPIAVFLVMLTTRNKYTYQTGIIVLAIFLVYNVLSFNIWTAIFCAFFIYIFMTEWKNSFTIGKKVILNHLPTQMQTSYAMLFVVFIAIDMLFGYFSVGTTVFHPLYILAVMLSALTFLSVILICRKFFDAAYFYLAYLVLSIISYGYALFNSFVSLGVINVVIVATILLIILKMLMIGLFIKENK